MKTNNRELFTKAHAMTKQIRKAGDDYRVTFGACLRHIRNSWSNQMNRLNADDAKKAMELKLNGDVTSSVIALVEDLCAYTAEQNPAAAERAENTNKAFGEWLLFGNTMAPAAPWIRANAKTGMTGKDWLQAAVKCGFQVPQ